MAWKNNLGVLIEYTPPHWHLIYGKPGYCQILGGRLCDPSNVPKTADQQTTENSQVPANNIAVTLQATPQVTFDARSGLYTYRYSFRNDNGSSLDVNSIQIPLDNAVVINLNAPTGWSANAWKGGSVVAFGATSTGTLPANYVDDGNLVPSPHQIKPGQTLDGFSFQSPYPPGAVDLLAQGFKPIPTLVPDEDANQPDLFDGSFTGTTIGPVFPANIYKNKIDEPWFFVRQHYIDFLGRDPEPLGLQGWRDILINCGATVQPPCDRIEVSSGFFRSSEFQDRGYFIFRFYIAGLGRSAHYNEFIPDLRRVSGFQDAAQLEASKVAFIQNFVNRAEFKAKYDSLTTPQAYVDGLLRTAGLLNHPTRQSWIDNLTKGTMTRAQVLRGFTESGEVYHKFYNTAFVVMQYFGYLRRDADILYLEWIKTMDQTGDYRTMINGFVNSLEYRHRFGP